MGLTKILIYSSFAGFSIVLAQQFGQEAAGVGISSIIIAILPGFSDPQIQNIAALASVVLAIFSIYNTGRFLAHIYENKLPGIATSMLGFFGSIAVFSIQESSDNFVFLGIGAWAIGIVIIILQNNRENSVGNAS